MQFFTSVVLLGSVALQTVFARPGPARLSTARVQLSTRAVGDFINTETPIALEQLLCNIGANGCNSAGVSSGLVIASPSKQDPDYWYTWTRDSALVFKSIVDRFTNSYDAGLQRHITDYIAAQARLQGVSNPSGGFSDGSGLAEPKYNVDGSAFTGAWGRPQRDGPALRAIAIMSYGEWLLDNSYTDTAKNIVWPVVRNDLEYVAQYWNQTGFDLWEEVNGSSFFTIASQHQALVQGYRFAARVGASGAHYQATAPSVLCFLQSFWNPSKGYIDSNINVNDGRTGLDANSILASIHTFDASIGCDSTTFQPCSDKALSNLKAVVDSFRFYNINNGIPKGTALAVGRYAEDVYYNGNPWYLNTLAAAEQLYDAVYVWKQQGSVTVTATSRAFFADLIPNIAVGTYQSGSSTYNSIIQAVSQYGDGFVNVVATYAQSNGSLAEQFSKQDGTPLSARDLTWSYASFLTAAARRAGVIPRPWSGGVEALPGTCSAVSFTGSYTSATATNFPASQTPVSGTGTVTVTGTSPPTTSTTAQPPSTTTACAIAPQVTVNFVARVVTNYGDTVKLVGNVDKLGNWNPSSGVVLSASDYQANNPVWKGSVVLSAGQSIQYKYVKVLSDGTVKWEADPNRTYSVPRSCATAVSRSDTWQT